MQETWKTIKGYPNYEISNLGNVKSLSRITRNAKCSGYKRKERLLKQFSNKKGYLMVKLYSEKNKSKSITVHRLVAQTFIPNPNNLPQVNHKDENKMNNSVDNLEWCTNEYNHNYGTAKERVLKSNINNGLYKKMAKRMAKKVCQVDQTGNVVKIWNSIKEAGMCGFDDSCISSCCKGKRKTHKGFEWKYYIEN